ncbi:type I DNA topoisomerase [Thermosulfurimonas marina]|uniref:DNA topoisomerase 1 n=1 Tax=Thermosulfurimonas marina TaxID=2047767 RepID=A0A6H1WQJ9_9BACT|nr:type I DNA topoisomerase [Thermosulfurimonas marina]QJA05438.1 type I DNA topoisomerase [Thermosulfurimonas marina]
MGKQGLIVVESPTKVRTIKKVVGKDYEVCASVGHVKDLPKNRLGVDVEDGFEPEYETLRGKKKVLSEIKRLARAVDQIYLAPDPDREGEAIAWHIAEELRPLKKPVKRLLLYELTPRGIREALKKPAELDPLKYEAQKARRVLDRLVGYHLSPLLWEKVKRGLSAGRVQSVALRLICEREAEIRAFRPEEYWTIEAEFLLPSGESFRATLQAKEGKRLRPQSEAEARALLEDLRRVLKERAPRVSKILRREVQRKPPAPFITSTLQQEAFRRFRFPAKKTMYLAQRLYEGIELPGEGPVGLITYMRTDSVRLAPEAQKAARELISQFFGPDFVPERPPQHRTRGPSAQEAHEAIRPTRFDLSPEALSGVLPPEEHRLYTLIWRRFLASQMVPARFEATNAEIALGPYTFVARGRRLLHPGFLAAYEVEEDQTRELPPLKEKGPLRLAEILPEQHFTRPPARYTEATLIRTLEEKGIGRPSTYAQIVSTIRERGYVESVSGSLRPTELGLLVNELLVTSFEDLIHPEFTARMENFLDEISAGRADRRKVLAEFYEELIRALKKAEAEMASFKAGVPVGLRCPECGEDLLLRVGKAGPFLACVRWPDCRFTADYERDEEGNFRIKERENQGVCPECGGALVLRRGRFGEFLACANYPDCRYTRPVGTGVACPREGCGGEIVKRRSRRGKTYYACSRAPECDFVLWEEPLPEKCPACGAPFLVIKQGRQGGKYCPQCKERFPA